MMAPGHPVSFEVVIPNYNHAAFLAQCLESVVTQTHQPKAIHVLDDASTDHSAEIITEYTRRYSHVHFHRQTRNRGAWSNLNRFFPQLSSTHLFCLAADDYLYPGCFENAYALLSAHPQAGVCLADHQWVFPDGTEECFRYRLSNVSTYFPPAQVPEVLRGVMGLMGQCFLRIEGVRQVGGFPSRLRWHTDSFICWVMALRFGLCYVPKAGGAFRVLPGSYSNRGMRSPAKQRHILKGFLHYLNQPAFSDLRPAARDSWMLAMFGEELLALSECAEQDRYFLTGELWRWAMWQRIRRHLRHPLPKPAKRWVRRHLLGKES